ncbi:GNAT family N-acetyltransferase [Flaviflagellibacter deserti]|uniref:GNAT family N-acetyltransferase n=1 Tax=Flaviflagellibacter deserti TaxID=2267266 RepID=A0ABV9Z4X8_9HYPH
MTLTIRPARPGDAALILRLVHELAEYEKLTHEVLATEELIDAALFGPSPRVFCEISEWDGEPVGQALWYYTFSTFTGRGGLYLEDLYVRPEARGKGIGKALLIHLARRCVDENLTRFEWSVLDWNTPSIEFYKSQGAVMTDGWTGCRVSGEALNRLAEKGA